MEPVQQILHHLRTSQISISSLITSLLMSNHAVPNPNDFLIQDLGSNIPIILSVLYYHPPFSEKVTHWAHDLMRHKYGVMARSLSHKTNGWHFSALHTEAEQIHTFQIEEMAEQMQTQAPQLWDVDTPFETTPMI